MNYKNSKLVEVHWRDAYTIDGWHTWDELMKKVGTGERCKTVGWLVYEDDTRFVLATSLGLDFTDSEVGSAWIIPKGMVDDVRVLDYGEQETTGQVQGSS